MNDLIFAVVVVALFVAGVAYARFCEKL